MPEFLPMHTPGHVTEFTRGYLECAEWLALRPCFVNPSRDDRDTLKGFTRAAVRKARADCDDFQKANKVLLMGYYGHGYTAAQAGRDFFLSRNRHGTGFSWRGNDYCFGCLHDAATVYGNCDCVIVRNRMTLT